MSATSRNNDDNQSGPDQSRPVTIGIVEFFEMFPDNKAAREWIEETFWPNGNRFCPRCDSENTKPASHPTMPYWCSDCRKYFSVKVGTVMEGSKISYQKWLLAVYFVTINSKGISSLQLHRQLNVSQPKAWHLGHRIREAMDVEPEKINGEAEMDETFLGGKEKNKHANKKLRMGRGAVGKAPVAGILDRQTRQIIVEPIPDVRRETLHALIREHVKPGSTVYTDEHRGYQNLYGYEHRAVKHKAGQYVDGEATTNSVESFWALFKRGYHGVYHHFSNKHSPRYSTEFSERYNLRGLDTLEQMMLIVLGMAGKRLRYRDLVDGN